MYTIETFTITIHTSFSLGKLMPFLVNKSWWFAITPLPDDHWDVTVKKENNKRIIDLLKEAGLK